MIDTYSLHCARPVLIQVLNSAEQICFTKILLGDQEASVSISVRRPLARRGPSNLAMGSELRGGSRKNSLVSEADIADGPWFVSVGGEGGREGGSQLITFALTRAAGFSCQKIAGKRERFSMANGLLAAKSLGPWGPVRWRHSLRGGSKKQHFLLLKPRRFSTHLMSVEAVGRSPSGGVVLDTFGGQTDTGGLPYMMPARCLDFTHPSPFLLSEI